MTTFERITDSIASLLAEGNQILALAESQRHYMYTLEAAARGDDRPADSATDSETEQAFGWVEFRAEYERWYTSCLGLMNSIQSDRMDDFRQLYLDDEPDLPSIKKVLLRGFSVDNYFGFRDRVENQVAILSSLEGQTAHMVFENRNAVAVQRTAYVDSDRLSELRSLSGQGFDLTKLIRLCEELNICYANQCYFAVAMLARAVVDHVPPILGCSKFSEIANNYPGTRSFKESMEHLGSSLRKIADAHLHVQIRSKESLPNRTQVNFSNDFDVLLAEIARVLK